MKLFYITEQTCSQPAGDEEKHAGDEEHLNRPIRIGSLGNPAPNGYQNQAELDRAVPVMQRGRDVIERTEERHVATAVEEGGTTRGVGDPKTKNPTLMVGGPETFGPQSSGLQHESYHGLLEVTVHRPVKSRTYGLSSTRAHEPTPYRLAHHFSKAKVTRIPTQKPAGKQRTGKIYPSLPRGRN